MTTQFDPNTSEIDKKICTDGWFVKSMPDLNQSNPLVMNYLIQNTIWWIEYADLDGLRVDTYSYTDKDNIAKWTKAITNEYPNLNISGEVWFHNSAHIAYWQKDSKIAAIQNYNSHLPGVMDFTLHNAFSSKVFNEDKATWNEGIVRIYENFANDFMYSDINNLMVFFENHDTHRFNHLYPDVKKYQMAMGILATIRGIPQIYYGSEIGMSGNKDKGDADIRQDFPGGWETDTQNAFKKESRTATQNLYFDFTQKVLNWRKNKTVIHTGKTTHFVPENNIYVYFRQTETVMVVVNNNSTNQTINTSRFKESIKNYSQGLNILDNSTISVEKEINIEAKSILILELK
jgi:glycosidase